MSGSINSMQSRIGVPTWAIEPAGAKKELLHGNPVSFGLLERLA
jgi:hypothetical protein